MTQSMTGFASGEGSGFGWRWTWDIRSVNGRGLDLRFRLPEWPPEIEPALRAILQKTVSRGNVTVSLRVFPEDGASALSLNMAAVDSVLAMATEIEARANEAGVSLAKMSAADVINVRAVTDGGGRDLGDPEPLRQALVAGFAEVCTAFVEMRTKEGAALEMILRDQVDQVERAVEAAQDMAGPRAAHLQQSFHDALDRISERLDRPDDSRVAQEIATMAVKADVTEELDRLRAHIIAARALLDESGPKGRKLDFLTQEFNREANTLCAKSSYANLTQVGLDLKHTVDQMREQVQNVE